jgi:four helix bundle protein
MSPPGPGASSELFLGPLCGKNLEDNSGNGGEVGKREERKGKREEGFAFHLIFLFISFNFEIGMSIALDKSRKFAIKVYYLYKKLCEEKHEYTLAKQLLRSGTSIGANLSEAQYAISKKEFLAKATISLKECAETEYWLDLLKETNLLTPEEYTDIIKDCKDILHLLISTVKTTKASIKEK